MKNSIIKEIEPKLEDISKFIKFRRKLIKSEIQKLLKDLDEETLNNLEDHKLQLGKKNDEINVITDVLDNYRIKHETLEEKYDKLKESHRITAEKFDFVGEVLFAEPNYVEGLQKFKDLLYGEFLDFANDESSLAEEANALLRLQAIERELELIATFPSICNKNLLAIGGGFSSGKSSFVNSFIKEENIELPVGIKPVTAIPTYIIAGVKNEIKGFSNRGGIVDIRSSFYKKLSYDFIKTFKFNLKDIMPYVAIKTPLDDLHLKHVCLIDTPGYDSAVNDGFTTSDKKTAFEFLAQSNVIIWMIGLDSNGTLPNSDLEFLSELDLEDRKLYIIANKADLRAESDMKAILAEIAALLDDYDIEYAGVSAYSSNLEKEFMHKKASLYDFLKKANNPCNVEKKIIEDINSVLDLYKKSIAADKMKVKKIKSKINTIELDLVALGVDTDDSGYRNLKSGLGKHIMELKRITDCKGFEEQASNLEKVRKKMTNIVGEFFQNIITAQVQSSGVLRVQGRVDSLKLKIS